MRTHDCLIIGSGIYGLTAALALRGRGHDVGLLDPGPVPHPLAASTDISKVVRMEYGTDSEYTTLADEAISGWQRWNDEFGETLYHEVGLTMLTRTPMAPGGFEFESYERLLARGHAPERLDAATIARRFPAWATGSHVDGFFNPRGGFVESGQVLKVLRGVAGAAGVHLHDGCAAEDLVRVGDRVDRVVTSRGDFCGDRVVVCAGAWTPWLVPELLGAMRATGHSVFHLAPRRPELFAAERFPVFTADIAATGWYGFPLHPTARVVKIGTHGVGIPTHPELDERVVPPAERRRLEAFLETTFPDLVDAPVVHTRLCLYSDTLDEHYWIDRHPELANLTVAAGGSGHAFKMAPVLGDLIADAVEGTPNARTERFRWRQLADGTPGREEARWHGVDGPPS